MKTFKEFLDEAQRTPARAAAAISQSSAIRDTDEDPEFHREKIEFLSQAIDKARLKGNEWQHPLIPKWETNLAHHKSELAKLTNG